MISFWKRKAPLASSASTRPQFADEGAWGGQVMIANDWRLAAAAGIYFAATYPATPVPEYQQFLSAIMPSRKSATSKCKHLIASETEI
jgi:hypothetical protein